MQIVVLAAFVINLTLVESGTLESLAKPSWWVLPGLAAYVAVAAALACLDTAVALRAFRRSGEITRSAARKHNLLLVLGQAWLVAGLGAVVACGYGRWVMEDLAIGPYALGALPLVGKLVVLAPFAAALVLTWWLDYPFHRASRLRLVQDGTAGGAADIPAAGMTGSATAGAADSTAAPARPAWTRAQYVAFNVRHQLLFIAVPVALIILLTDLVWLYLYPLLGPGRSYILFGAMAAAAGGVFLFSPVLIVRIWQTQRLGDGPLRRDLEDLFTRMRLRCRQILIWKSGGVIINAGVMGLLAPVRYVLLSDALLDQMTEPEVKSIFAHEAGHIVHHHIFYAALFGISTVLLCGSAGDLVAGLVARLLSDLPWLGMAVALVLLGLSWGLGFGWLSRRFERQSDVEAAWISGAQDGQLPADGRITMQGATAFADALHRVGLLNGISPWQGNWRHGSIAYRIDYVIGLAQQGLTKDAIGRTVRRIKIALWAVLAASVAVTVLQFVNDPNAFF